MKLDNLNKWLTLVANLGVVVGIFFLAFEVRQNQEILEQNHQMNLLTARNNDIQQYHEWRRVLIQDKAVAQLWMSGSAGEELAPVEEMRFLLMCISSLWADASMYERSVALGRRDTTAQTITTDIRSYIDELPGYKDCWEATKDSIADYGFEDFVESVDSQD